MATPLDRPKLRPGLAAARDDRDPHAVVVYDQFRLTRQFLRLSPREFTWLQWLDGSNTLRDVQYAAMRQSGGELLPIAPLIDLVEKLDAALFLDGPRFEAFLTGPVREPACLGCYAAEPDELRRQLAGYFTCEGGPGLPEQGRRGEAEKGRNGSLSSSNGRAGDARLRALLAPHIDYARGGVSYAWGFKELAERTDASLFVIVGTSHYSPERFTLTRQNFKTPLGIVPTEQAFVDRLVESYGDGLFDDPLAHVPEHSIELEVVFLQYLFEKVRPIRIVPLVVGSFHDRVESGGEPAEAADVARMIEALRKAEAGAGEPICYVISGDLAHIGPKFGDPGRVTEAQLAVSRAQDDALIARAEAVDPAGFFRVIEQEGDARRICGLPPTYTVLHATKPARGKMLHYGRYVHPRGHESVSFASMAFYA
jgi:MEMO1 family protein